MNRKHTLLILLVFLTLGMTLGSSNYEFQIERIDAGDWVEIPVQIEEYSVADTTYQYIDATQSTTYGTVTNDPPDGMGEDSDGPTYDTELLEESYVDTSYSLLASYTGTSWPSGWSDVNFVESSTYAYCNGYQTGTSGSVTSATYDLSSYVGVRINFDYKFADLGLGAGDFYVQSYESSSYTTVWTYSSGGSTWTDIIIDRTGSWSNWNVKFVAQNLAVNVPTESGEEIDLDNIYVYGIVSNTYYRFDAAFRFDSVTTGLNSYFLYVDFYSALTGSDELTFYASPTLTNPISIVEAHAQDDFNVDITSFVTGSTLYLRIADSYYRTGDTVQTTAYIQRIYLYSPNAVPQSSQPVVTNAETDNNLYQMYQPYLLDVSVTDTDGYSDIDYVTIQFRNETFGHFGMRYTESTNTFTEEINTALGQLDTSICDYSKSGTSIDLTFGFWLEFGAVSTNTLLRTGMGFRVVVYDTETSDTTDYFDVDYTIDGRTTLNLSITDGSGTINRGDIDGAISASVQVGYLTNASLSPAEDTIYITGAYIWITTDGAGTFGSEWEATNYDGGSDGDGTASVTVYADDTVGLDTFTGKISKYTYSGGEAISTDTAIYIADRINFTSTTSETWVLIGTSIDAYIYAHYEYDGASYTGSVTWTDDSNGTVTHSTYGNFSFHPTSFTDTTHGITAKTNTSSYCIWDTILISSVSYYWVQYSEEQVWLVWNPSTYTWAVNGSVVQDGIKIQSKMNGTNDDWSITNGGTTGDFSIGSFNPSWYYANISIYAQPTGYSWIIWSQVLEVDILHSLQVVSFNIIPTDDYFWIQYQTNLLNASITIWDDAIDSGTLFSDSIYHSIYEGMHQIAVSSIIGVHNVTICITSTGIEYDRDYTFGYYTWWYNMTYIVQESLSVNDPVYTNNEVKNYLSGLVTLGCSYYVYENNTEVKSGVLAVGSFSIDWNRNTSIGLCIWGIKFNSSTIIRWVNGSYYNAPETETELDFVITTWDIDWQDYYVYITWATSWGNSTIVPYEDGLPASGTTESYTLQYEKATLPGNHTLDFLISGGGINTLWKNYSYTISESAAQEGEIRFAFFDTANNWIPFETVNCILTYDSTSYVLTSSVATVDTSKEFNLEVRGRWGELLHNSSFNYTQFKSIVLTVYELIIENEADHPVRIDMSYNGTYPNITIMIPTQSFQRLYVPSANYTVIFTYYSGRYTSDQIINYEEMTGYFVTYHLELLGISYLKYTGISMYDIDYNINYSRDNINSNVDVVDFNVLAIPYPPNVPQNIVTPEMMWIVVGAFGVIAFLFALGGSIFRGGQIAKKSRTFYKSQGAVAEEIADAEGKEYYRGSR